MHSIKAYRDKKGMAPCILNLGTGLRSEVDIMPQPL